MRVFLPRIDSEPRTGDRRECLAISERGEETVLVVEDETLVRTLICQVLQNHGYRVLEAGHGVEALVECNRNPLGSIDLLLTDVVMPQMGGGELADQIRNVLPDIRILFMSGYTDEIEIEEMLSSGGDFIKKPFLPETLVAKVRQTLDQPTQVDLPE